MVRHLAESLAENLGRKQGCNQAGGEVIVAMRER